MPEVIDLGVYDGGGRGHVGHTPRDAAVPTPDAMAQAPDAGSPQNPPPACASSAAGCVSAEPLDYDVPADCYELTAHAPEDPSAPYQVSTEPDIYVRFTTRAPHDGARTLRSIANIIDDERPLHRMRLYTHAGALPEGVSEGGPLPPELRLVFTWAPGTPSMYLDPDLGISLAAGTWYTLELHYNSLQPLTDRSGFEICVTPNQAAYPVSFSRLGTREIAGRSASGECTPETDAPILLLGVQPRLGIRGRNASLVLESAAGAPKVVYDQPFDFAATGFDVLSQRVLPGESLTTTCSYSQSVRFGTGVDDANCDLYVLHWPARSLVSTPSVGQPDSCAH